jgi:choline transporter-like protein 2/4/5
MNKYAFANYVHMSSQILHLINNTFVSAFTRGDPSKLLSATDMQGQVCGVDTGVRDKPYLFFFDLTMCAASDTVVSGCPTPQVCLELCFTW